MLIPKIKAHPKIVAENNGTPPSSTNLVSINFKLVSMAPEPKNNNMGNNKLTCFTVVSFFSFTEVK